MNKSYTIIRQLRLESKIYLGLRNFKISLKYTYILSYDMKYSKMDKILGVSKNE